MSFCRFQQGEFGIPVTEADQPDLADIPAFYQSGTGGFWVARAHDEVVGTVGLKDIGLRQAALRKMFVASPFRGRELGVAGRLLDALLAHARTRASSRSFSAPRINFPRRTGSTKRRVLRSCQRPTCPGRSRSWSFSISKFYVLRLP